VGIASVSNAIVVARSPFTMEAAGYGDLILWGQAPLATAV